LRPCDLAGAKVGNEQLLAAEHVKGQITVAAVVAVKEALCLGSFPDVPENLLGRG
jgi:hypothetical protein